MREKVILVDNIIKNKPIEGLTLRKAYEVVSENEQCYVIIDDYGRKHSLNKIRFN
jgi:hypothetical protein